jgi:hypothetical protein
MGLRGVRAGTFFSPDVFRLLHGCSADGWRVVCLMVGSGFPGRAIGAVRASLSYCLALAGAVGPAGPLVEAGVLILGQ